MISKVLNYSFYALLLFLVAQRLPAILDNYDKEGEKVQNFEYELLSGVRSNLYSIEGKKILVFWASWCPPCKVEIMRLNKAIAKGELDRHKVFFVNIGESKKQILKYFRENKINLITIMDKDSSISKTLNIQGTPTVLHIDENNEIDHVATGVSPLLIFRASRFLD